MYSLYRAWFGDGATGENYSRLQETLSPPDTVVRVGNEGEHQFVAHKGVLAAHSGYLKALLMSAAASPSQIVNANVSSCESPATAISVTAANQSGQSAGQPVTSVSVSSIGGEAFAPLLNYMYTGRLDVTLDNVYSVLLATHLLHMPGALEQCRAALLRLRAPPPLPAPITVPASTSTSGSGSILRPIPNRLIIDPGMCWPPAAPIYPTAASTAPGTIGLSHLPRPSVLLQSAVSHGVPVVPTTGVQETHGSTAYRFAGSSLDTRRKENAMTVKLVRSSETPSPKATTLFQIERARMTDPTAKTPFAAFATSNAATSTRTPSPCRTVSPAPSTTASRSPLPSRQAKNNATEGNRSRRTDRDHETASSSRDRAKRRSSPFTPVEESAVARDRQGNEDAASPAGNDRGSSSKRRGRGSNGGNDGSASVLSVVYDVACCDGPVRFHRVLNENYSSTASCGSGSLGPRSQRPCYETGNGSSENDENGGPRDPGATCPSIGPGMDGANASGSYTCGYCRHTFKSQYCYRKHTKRHLLPTGANESDRQRQDTGRNRREVRLLDLNVQYYPCKICGCKFPSYYFVHKHRKLCHGNGDERGQSDEANGSVTEDQESTSSTTNNERQ